MSWIGGTVLSRTRPTHGQMSRRRYAVPSETGDERRQGLAEQADPALDVTVGRRIDRDAVNPGSHDPLIDRGHVGCVAADESASASGEFGDAATASSASRWACSRVGAMHTLV